MGFITGKYAPSVRVTTNIDEVVEQTINDTVNAAASVVLDPVAAAVNTAVNTVNNVKRQVNNAINDTINTVENTVETLTGGLIDVEIGFGGIDGGSNIGSPFKGDSVFTQPQENAYLPDFGGTSPNLLWIVLEARELKRQTWAARSGIGIGGKIVRKFRFIAPMELMENVAHDWSTKDNLKTSMEQTVETFEQASEAAGEIGNVARAGLQTFVSGITSQDGNAIPKSVDATTSAAKASATALGNTEVPKTRIDLPLVYTNSSRREYQITTQLVSTTNAYRNVLEPVKALERLSSPKKVGNSTEIDWPHIFTIYTYPKRSIINIKYAALTSVTPTFIGPYINGIPVKCDLTLSFTDISPLFAREEDEVEVTTSTK